MNDLDQHPEIDEVDCILGDYLERVDRGEKVSAEDLIAAHPKHAESLREYFTDAAKVDDLLNEAEQNASSSRQPAVRYIGDYELLSQLGAGGMGVVYLARQKSLKRLVAVKMIRPEYVHSEEVARRFHREAEEAAQLHQPNIVSIYEVGQHAGRHYFSMDYVAGPSLAQELESKPLAGKKAAELLKTVAEAVHYAHTCGVIHRDIKPQNILLDESGKPHLTDFGLAKRLDGEGGMTRQGLVLGTASYMSPEQASGRGKLSIAGDVYSLGATLYHAIVGRPPFQVDSEEETLRQVIHEQPTLPRMIDPDIDRDLETICMTCLEKDPANRYYKSAGALAEDLGRYLSGRTIEARPAGSVERFWRWCRREPKVAGLLAALFLVLVAGVYVSSWQAMRATNAEGAAIVQKELAEEAERKALAEASRVKGLLDVVVSSFYSVNPWAYGQVADGSAIGVLLRMQQRVLEEPMPETPLEKATLLGEISNALCGLDRFIKATEGFEESLALRKMQLGADHRDTLGSMRALADCYEAKGYQENNTDLLRQATNLREEAVRRATEAYGPNDRATLVARGSLACGSDGIATMEDIVKRADATFGPEDDLAIRLKHNLAVTYAQSGRPAEAVKLYLQALELGRQVLEVESVQCDPKNIMLLGNLGGAYHALGELQEARKVLKKTYELDKEWLGQPYAVWFLQGVLIDLGEYQRAEEVLRELLAASTSSLRDHSQERAWAEVSLAAALLGQRRPEEARLLAEGALAASRIEAEEADRAKSIIGACLAAAGNWNEAEPMLLEAFTSLQARLERFPFADDHEIPYKRFYVTRACQRVIDMYEARGDEQEAEKWEATLKEIEEDIRKKPAECAGNEDVGTEPTDNGTSGTIDGPEVESK